MLIHGLFGFRKLLCLEYFQGVRQLYQSMGLRVLTPSLPWSGSIVKRANALARQLANEMGPLHLLAHSMGGLDARHWISVLGGGDKAASLTTLSTPHNGSTAADRVCGSYSLFRIFAGVRNLTTTHLKKFNAQTPDHPAVIYRSYAAMRPLCEQPWLVRRYGRYIQMIEGDNDSQVSVHSAIRGEHISTLPCDHFELIFRNFWFNPLRSRNRFDPMPMYRDIGHWILRMNTQQESTV